MQLRLILHHVGSLQWAISFHAFNSIKPEVAVLKS
jgi:hypothetical protein